MLYKFSPVSPQYRFHQLLYRKFLCLVPVNYSLQAHATVLHIQLDMSLLMSKCLLRIITSWQKCAYTLPRHKAGKDSDRNYRKLHLWNKANKIFTQLYINSDIQNHYCPNTKEEGKERQEEEKRQNNLNKNGQFSLKTNWIKLLPGLTTLHKRHLKPFRGDQDLKLEISSFSSKVCSISKRKLQEQMPIFYGGTGNAYVSTGTITSICCDLDLLVYWHDQCAVTLNTQYEMMQVACVSLTQPPDRSLRLLQTNSLYLTFMHNLPAVSSFQAIQLKIYTQFPSVTYMLHDWSNSSPCIWSKIIL